MAAPGLAGLLEERDFRRDKERDLRRDKERDLGRDKERDLKRDESLAKAMIKDGTISLDKIAAILSWPLAEVKKIEAQVRKQR